MTKPSDSNVENSEPEELTEAAQALVEKVRSLAASERTRLAILGRVIAQGDAETSLNRLDGSDASSASEQKKSS
jgi:hypothetical protein